MSTRRALVCSYAVPAADRDCGSRRVRDLIGFLHDAGWQVDFVATNSANAPLARPLRPRGTLTFVVPAALLPEAAAAFTTAGCAPTAMLPLWPKPRHLAKLLLLRGVKGSRAPFRVLPGLVLHAPDGTFTAEADAILRGGAALDL